jgi:exosortase
LNLKCRLYFEPLDNIIDPNCVESRDNADYIYMGDRITGHSFSAHLKRHLMPYILMAALVLLNIPVFIGLLGDWLHDGNYSHGFLVIPISIYLIYRRKSELVFPAAPSRSGLVLLILGCFGLVFGTAASEFFTTRFSLVVCLSGLALYYLGAANFKKIWFAFFFLLFMIPIPATIYYAATLPMQLFATRITNVVLHYIGVPSNREGNIILLPAYQLEVTEACSGLRSLATLLALGALFGNLTLPGRIRPIILFLSAIPIAIVVNIFRLVFTGVGAYAISPKMAASFLHELSGILVFILALILMSILAGLLRWKRNRS